MFYPEEILKKGGRFYLLWVADSWPHRFQSISPRQLWSRDVRQLCDELHKLVISESGRPSHRYSLRLSSQLLRGLVRFYQRKVSVYLSELCMLNAKVSKANSKKYIIHDETEQGRQPRAIEQAVLPAEPENEQRIEEILQNNSNVVAHIQDITLREAVINEPVLPPNEGFGEENAEQALQFLSGRRSVEHMMEAGGAAQLSALGLPALDASRPLERSHRARMERLSDHDLTALRPSDGGLLSTTGVGKEISDIPDASILPIPELPAPEEKQPEEQEMPIEVPRNDAPPRREITTDFEPTLIELEELEEMEPRAKRRRRLIIDKKIKISSDVLRARINNPRVELRCEDVSEAISEHVLVPCEVLLGRPSRGGARARQLVAPALVRLFVRNLGLLHRDSAHRDFEQEELRGQRYQTTSRLQTVPEIVEPAPEPHIEKPQEISVVEDNLPPPEVELEAANVTEQQDTADMSSQKITPKITFSKPKETKKRSSSGVTPSPKKSKSASAPAPSPEKPRVLQELEGNVRSYVSLRESQRRLRGETPGGHAEAEKLPEFPMEFEKENIGTYRQTLTITPRAQKGIMDLLHEAGLADRQQETADEEPAVLGVEPAIHRPRDSSETGLGSPDRTEVSLGESEESTKSRRFIKDHWGAEGTLNKIIKCVHKRRNEEPITIRTLIANGPIIAELKMIIIAKCFSSILRLKQHGFILIKKCPNTLEILDITTGPKLQRVPWNV